MKSLLSVKAIIGIVCGAVVTAAAIITAVVVLNKPESYRLIKVFELDGTAVIQRADIGSINAYSGMSLENGDEISVGSDSFLRLELDSDKYILIEEGSKLSIDATGDAENSRTVINLSEGAILNEITNKLSDGSSFEVNTPKATMSVRGTSFRIVVQRINGNEYITEVQTFDGKVGVQLYDESGKTTGNEVLVGEGKSAQIKTNKTDENDSSETGYSEFIFDDEDIDFDKLPQLIAEYIVASSLAEQMDYPPEVVEKARERAEQCRNESGIQYSFGFGEKSVVSINSDTITETTVPEVSQEETSVPESETSENNTDISLQPVTTTTVVNTTVTTVTPATSVTPTTTVTEKTVKTDTTVTSTTPVTTTATTAETDAPSGSSGSNSTTTEETLPIAKKYTVKFYNLDETLNSTEIVDAGDSIIAPEISVDANYQIEDWLISDTEEYFSKTVVYESAGYPTQYAFTYNNVNRNLNVYPQKVGVKYRVNFNAGSGGTASVQYINCSYKGLVYYRIGDVTATATGKTFSHWSYNGTEVDSDFEMPAHDITLVAVYEVEEYTITYHTISGFQISDLSTGAALGTATLNANGGDNLLSALSSVSTDGGECQFEGWYKDATYSTPVGSDDVITEDTYVYAKYMVYQKQVEFTCSGSSEDPITLAFGFGSGLSATDFDAPYANVPAGGGTYTTNAVYSKSSSRATTVFDGYTLTSISGSGPVTWTFRRMSDGENETITLTIVTDNSSTGEVVPVHMVL